MPESAFKIKLAEAAWAFPVVGLILGLAAAACAYLSLWLGAHVVVTSGISLIVLVLLTGALHEDGLADVADGFGGGHTVARKLEIMRDSHIGAYGVIALVISLVLRFVFIYLILTSNQVSLWYALPVALMTGRVFMLVAMAAPGVLKGGGKSLGQKAGVASNLVAVIWVGLAAGLIGAVSVTGFIVVLTVGLMARHWVMRQIGSMTGDAYGFIEQVTHVTTLAIFVSIAS